MTQITRRAIPIPKQIDQPTSVSIKQAEGVIGALADEVGVALTAVEGRATSLEASSADHETRIAALETTIADHETRIAALETTVADHETRITALEP